MVTIPTLEQIIAAHPPARGTEWPETARILAGTIAATYRIDSTDDLRTIPDDTLIIDAIGNLMVKTPLMTEQIDVELPVWILPRIDQADGSTGRPAPESDGGERA
ncbi:hypothetical protein [Gordonia sp. SND2]|uniref:hypothetical protein n=1 Tax=Gordonia sp. SND2 TaxID=3388659 RepID=UPI00398B4726